MDRNEYLTHEAVDRLFIYSRQFNEHILAHPAIVDDVVFSKRAADISARIEELYLAALVKHLGENKGSNHEES
jgi:hypothetical protein